MTNHGSFIGFNTNDLRALGVMPHKGQVVPLELWALNPLDDPAQSWQKAAVALAVLAGLIWLAKRI